MAAFIEKIGLYYDKEGYVEPVRDPRRRGGSVGPGSPAKGLLGRHVAGSQFLRALFRHGRWSGLVAVVPDDPSEGSIRQFLSSPPGGPGERSGTEVLKLQDFHDRFLASPPTPLLHFPDVPDPAFAWARQLGGSAGFALSGVTHSLASLGGVGSLRQLVTAPFEPYDTLICTSESVLRMVRAATGVFCDYLDDRFGGRHELVPRLEHIPLGVDTDALGPAAPDRRELTRQTMGIADDEVVVLYVGRLSFHAKANPYPMFQGVSRAARLSGRRVHLLLSGWAASDQIRQAFRDGARVFAPGVRVTIVDGTKPEYRSDVWAVADLFTSLSDSVQETFGLAISEAMASGLPVVASDWNGSRDQVVDGETGYLVPTQLVRDATWDATSRLLVGEIGYDKFLADCSQVVCVDVEGAARAYERLFTDDALRRRMGEAGRLRAVQKLSWSAVIPRYEELWAEADSARRSHLDRPRSDDRNIPAPSAYPRVEKTFESYPSGLLDRRDMLVAAEHAAERLDWLLRLPISNYSANRRCSDPATLRAAIKLAREPIAIGELEDTLPPDRADGGERRATLAWMIKYGLLLIADGIGPRG